VPRPLKKKERPLPWLSAFGERPADARRRHEAEKEDPIAYMQNGTGGEVCPKLRAKIEISEEHRPTTKKLQPRA
jgi:hypothetical protein